MIRDDKTRKAVGYDFECKIETASKKFNIPILKLPKAHSIKGGLVKKSARNKSRALISIDVQMDQF